MIPRPRCVYIEPEINDAARLYTLKVQKSRSRRPARLRSYRKLHQYRLCQETRHTNTKTYPRKETLQCGRNPEQSRSAEILCGHDHENRRKGDPTAVLPYGPRGKPSHTRLPLVRQRPTENRLGQRMDRLRPITHRLAKRRRRQSNIHHPRPRKKSGYQTGKNRRKGPPPIPSLYGCIQRRRIKEVPTKKTMGSPNQTETRSPRYIDQQNNPLIHHRAARTRRVHQRARS